MNKKIIITASIITALLLLGGVVWSLRQRAVENLQPLNSPPQTAGTVQAPVTETAPAANQKEPTKEELIQRTEDWWKNYQALSEAADKATTTSGAVAEPGPTVEPSRVVNPDADSDGLTIEQEANIGTDPNIADTDGDGLTDRQEVETYKTDPLKADTDGDTFPDGSEVQAGYNPLGAGRCVRETCIP